MIPGAKWTWCKKSLVLSFGPNMTAESLGRQEERPGIRVWHKYTILREKDSACQNRGMGHKKEATIAKKTEFSLKFSEK